MSRLESAPGMGERPAGTLLIGRVAGAPRVINTPSGVTVTWLSLAVCGELHELVTFGTEAERAAELVAGQVVCAEGRWQVRQEGRRELAVSSFAALAPRRAQEGQ